MQSNRNCLGYSAHTIDRAFELFGIKRLEDLIGSKNKHPICRTLSLSENSRTIAESRYYNAARKRALESYQRGGILLTLRTPPFQTAYHNEGVPPGEAMVESYNLLEPL